MHKEEKKYTNVFKNIITINEDGIDLGMSGRENDTILKTTDSLKPIRSASPLNIQCCLIVGSLKKIEQ